jgi:tRNA-binding protein
LEISYHDFDKVDVRVGKVTAAVDLPNARKPAYVLTIDFGSEVGVKKSSVQVTKHYRKEELIGELVLAVVNFPAKQIGSIKSEVLTLGVPDEQGEVVLVQPNKAVPVGGRLF